MNPEGMSGWWAMGWMGLLFWVVLVLAIAALIKYLFDKPRDR